MPDTLPHITILLCTYNGARYLSEQLESYVAQSHTDWALWVSDDGSDDDTLAILEAFRDLHGGAHDIRFVARTGPETALGPEQRAAANFLSLLSHPDLPPGAVALSDQDDVWLPCKLARALEQIGQLPATQPVLYGAQSRHVRADLTPVGVSHPPRRAPGFANALTQNIVSGHSLAMNAAALALVRRAGVPDGITFHDWWLYQLVSGASGQVHIDTSEVLLYRQHANNVMGAHRGLPASWGRVTMVLNRTYGRWIAQNIAALSAVRDQLTAPNARLLDLVSDNIGRGPAGAWQLHRAGLRRQSGMATALFYLTITFGLA